MINGFEQETGPLNDDEMVIAKWLSLTLRQRVGEALAITSFEITALVANYGIKLPPPRVRKVINFIRTRRMVLNLVATSKGYYIENDPDKLKGYVESLRQRASAINAVADSYAVDNHHYPTFNQLQTSLFS